ncbi:hypothetical protein HY988_03390 [Candidatus Micrarchaeota archaeon]|nr:hypothetical protein [Candidatus Micrarchaeota archaeon]
MDLIVDANILFAALIKNGITITLMVEPEIHLFAPEFLIEEVMKYRKEIEKKTKHSDEELNEIFESLKEKINFVPANEFQSFLKEAEKISPDEGDVPYIALALKLKIPLWTNDRDLKEKQTKVKVYSTKDILERGW